MAQSIKLGSNTYLDASGVVMSDHTTLDAHTTGVYKAPDGTMIEWGSITSPTPYSQSGSGWGPLYYHEYHDLPSYPVAFASDPSLIISKAGGRGAIVTWSSTSRTKINEIDIVFTQQTPPDNISFYWLAIGTWK